MLKKLAKILTFGQKGKKSAKHDVDPKEGEEFNGGIDIFSENAMSPSLTSGRTNSVTGVSSVKNLSTSPNRARENISQQSVSPTASGSHASLHSTPNLTLFPQQSSNRSRSTPVLLRETSGGSREQATGSLRSPSISSHDQRLDSYSSPSKDERRRQQQQQQPRKSKRSPSESSRRRPSSSSSTVYPESSSRRSKSAYHGSDRDSSYRDHRGSDRERRRRSSRDYDHYYDNHHPCYHCRHHGHGNYYAPPAHYYPSHHYYDDYYDRRPSSRLSSSVSVREYTRPRSPEIEYDERDMRRTRPEGDSARRRRSASATTETSLRRELAERQHYEHFDGQNNGGSRSRRHASRHPYPDDSEDDERYYDDRQREYNDPSYRDSRRNHEHGEQSIYGTPQPARRVNSQEDYDYVLDRVNTR